MYDEGPLTMYALKIFLMASSKENMLMFLFEVIVIQIQFSAES